MFALLAWAALTPACSLAEGYLHPSNYDLVWQTARIVLAKAVSSAPADPAKPDEQARLVTFEVQEVLKGKVTGKTLTVAGDTSRYDGSGDVTSFERPRPGAGRGACNAYDYRIGTSYLLFLPDTPGSAYGWFDGPAFSRINEEADKGSAWLAAVRHYVRISMLSDPAERRSGLLHLQAQVKSHPGDPQYPQQLALDIAEHFQTPSPHMSYQELLALYRHNNTREAALWAMAQAPKPEARALFASIVKSGRWRFLPGPITEFTSRTKDRRLTSELLVQLPKRQKHASEHEQRRESWLRRYVLNAAARNADAADMPHMLNALRSANAEERQVLAPWFARFPSTAGTALLKRSVGSQYRENMDLTFALASLGDADVLSWAQRTMNAQREDTWMSYYVVARSPLPLADELARQTIRLRNEKDLSSLIAGYLNSLNPNRWARLADVIALPNRSEEITQQLKTMLADPAMAGEPQAAALLRGLAEQKKG